MCYRGGGNDGDLTQLRKYKKRIDGSVEDELTKLMEGLTCSVSVVDYIGADDDDPIECDSEAIEHEAIENDNDGDSADEVTIEPSEALDCCLRLSSFLSLQRASDELMKKLTSITENFRQQCSMRKTQCAVDGFRLTLHLRAFYIRSEAKTPHILVRYIKGRL